MVISQDGESLDTQAVRYISYLLLHNKLSPSKHLFSHSFCGWGTKHNIAVPLALVLPRGGCWLTSGAAGSLLGRLSRDGGAPTPKLTHVCWHTWSPAMCAAPSVHLQYGTWHPWGISVLRETERQYPRWKPQHFYNLDVEVILYSSAVF